jgi:GT2 family glycosyltransferase
MLDISIILVNWNSGPMILTCLKRIFSELNSVRGECIVIDNASENGDRELLRREFPKLEVIANTSNLGFAKAVNQGIVRSRGRYLLLINPDAFLSPGTIASVVTFLDSRPEVGILGPRVLNPDGSVQGSARAFPQFATALFGRTSLISRLFPGNGLTRRQVLGQDRKLRRPLAVDWVSGAAMFVRRDVFEEVGLLDDRFFLFWEDADICWRAHKQGWPVIYYPEVSVTHLIGACSRHAPVRSLAAFHRSAFRLYTIHVTRSGFHPLNLVAAAGLSFHFVGTLVWRGLRWLARPLTSVRRNTSPPLDQSINEQLF